MKSQATQLRSISFDGGYGITGVHISSDDGQSWQAPDADIPALTDYLTKAYGESAAK